MKNAAKVAVSIPVEVLQALEKIRRRLRKSRSAAVTLAVQEWLRSQEVGELDLKYAQAYLKHPERADDVANTAKAVVATWDPWR